jgi:preprotein translocase subunit SecA
MVLDNMVMSNGLQQFIQIIHSLKISPEGLTTCYISTNKYLRGYASISGMTGTLGGPASRGMIRQVYGLDTVVIPTFKKRQFEEQRPIFVKGKNHLKEVAVRANKAATHNAVLIICKQIADARSIKDLLISNEYTNEKIYMYSRSDLEEVCFVCVNID